VERWGTAWGILWWLSQDVSSQSSPSLWEGGQNLQIYVAVPHMPYPKKNVKLDQGIWSIFGVPFIPQVTLHTLQNTSCAVLVGRVSNRQQHVCIRLHKPIVSWMFSYYPFCCVFLLPVHQCAVPVGRVSNRQQHVCIRLHKPIVSWMFSYYPFCCVFLLPVHQCAVLVGIVSNR
jgi:hypothetical protein